MLRNKVMYARETISCSFWFWVCIFISLTGCHVLSLNMFISPPANLYIIVFPMREMHLEAQTLLYLLLFFWVTKSTSSYVKYIASAWMWLGLLAECTISPISCEILMHMKNVTMEEEKICGSITLCWWDYEIIWCWTRVELENVVARVEEEDPTWQLLRSQNTNSTHYSYRITNEKRNKKNLFQAY